MLTNDELWKGVFEDLATDFIQKFYPDLYPYLDPSRPIEFLDKELAQLSPDSEDGKRAVDKLMKVYLVGMIEPRIIYIHGEVQGYPDVVFDERNFIYFYRLFDRFKGNIAVNVIYTDDNPHYKPSEFRYNCMGTSVLYAFPICKVMDQNHEQLANSENLFDTVLLTAYWAIQRKKNALSDEDLVGLKIDLMRRLLSKSIEKEKIRRLFDFINGYLHFEKPENNLNFEKKFDELVKTEKNMGITEILVRQASEKAREEALVEARKEAQAEIANAQEKAQEERHKERKNAVRNMRQLDFSVEKIAGILGLPQTDISAFFKELDAEK